MHKRIHSRARHAAAASTTTAATAANCPAADCPPRLLNGPVSLAGHDNICCTTACSPPTAATRSATGVDCPPRPFVGQVVSPFPSVSPAVLDFNAALLRLPSLSKLVQRRDAAK